MKNELRFALCAIKKNIQNSAELRTSFLSSVVGMTLNNASYVIVWMCFAQSVGNLNGWTPIDIIGLEGYTCLSFGLVFSIAYGIRNLSVYVMTGSFDRFIVSPKNLLVRIATAAFSAKIVGDLVFGVFSLALYAYLIHATATQVVLLLALIVPSTLIFFAAALMAHSASFFFVQAHAVTDGLFEMFMTPALFHGGAFQGPMRFIFTFIIPSLVLGTLPVEIIRTLSLTKCAIVGGVTLVWLVIAIKFFHFGLKHYESANFMTFGS